MNLRAVIFVSLCAAVIAEEVEQNYFGPGQLLNEINDSANKLFENSTIELGNVLQGIQKDLYDAEDKVKTLIAESEQKLQAIADGSIFNTYEPNTKQSTIRKCINEFEPKYEEKLHQGKSSLAGCVTDVLAQGKDKFVKDAEEDTAQITKNVRKVSKILGDCAKQGFLGGVRCTLEQGAQIAELSEAIKSSSARVLENAFEKSSELVTKVRTCSDGTISKTEESVNHLNSAYTDCKMR